MAEPSMTGMFNQALDLLADIISESAAFRTWYDAADAAAAKAMIQFYEFEDDDLARPRVLLDTTEMSGSGSAPQFRVHQEFIVIFEVDVPETYEDSTRQAIKDFMNNCGAAMAQILARPPEELRIASWRKIHGPARSDKRERAGSSGDDYIQAIFTIGAA
jgi:hypothetical protein